MKNTNFPLVKNQIIELEITGMTTEGNGVGRYDGVAVFVPMTAIGDRASVQIVKLEKSFCYGVCKEILKASSSRITPDCEVWQKCGGCSFRHISYSAELEIKQRFVSDAFERIGGLDVEFEQICGSESPDFYRNKAQFPVAEQEGKAVCGFYSKRSHRVVPFTACKLQPIVFQQLAEFVISFVNDMGISAYNEENNSEILRHIYIRRGEHSGEIMLCIVTTKSCKELFAPLVKLVGERFPDVKSVVMNVNPKKTNVILGDKTLLLSGKSTITDVMCGRKIEISPLSFYQVNTVQAERLYAIAESFAQLSGEETLLDLYCGAGTIGLSMAEKVKRLIGVEIIPQAVENAKENAKVNGVSNAEFFCGDASEVAQRLAEKGEAPDVIVIDPPRKGCDVKTLEAIAKMSPKRVVMISCNPATSARDAKIMNSLGYKPQKAQAVDLFPRTTHVECVVLMSRE